MATSVGWVWLVVLLPFVGFLTNGLIAFLRTHKQNKLSARLV